MFVTRLSEHVRVFSLSLALSLCVCVCVCVCVIVVSKAGWISCVLSSVCVCVCVCGHVEAVCGNPVLLSSHTLFRCSYKPLILQKMLRLL